ncbi:hypothetical protein SanaruYs_18740 [Chryseotalea sanaruensis]|uniref:LPS export ABC transporter periplasmic protein LptC n=1 Tax=Chryseotalea sanaruensis TaxID=2482724 RepID=A0A401U9R5_9BACT|nr:hypothetical protein [Chryseotalea sanaruensis]GCC51646.1 hypothetical protein SanaruYs_18740 [Chryseotalea sanaruensis]
MKKLSLLCLGLVAVVSGCNPASESAKFSVHDAKREQLASVSVGGEVIIDTPELSLTGIFKKEKRKYYDAGNTMQYAVKYSDDGFKLRDYREELLWKVKLYDDKIKIANNEEMSNAYEIKLRDEGKIKLERNDALVTELRMNNEAEWFQVNDAYTTRGAGLSLAPALLLIEELKDMEKFILMAELKAKGR